MHHHLIPGLELPHHQDLLVHGEAPGQGDRPHCRDQGQGCPHLPLRHHLPHAHALQGEVGPQHRGTAENMRQIFCERQGVSRE